MKSEEDKAAELVAEMQAAMFDAISKSAHLKGELVVDAVLFVAAAVCIKYSVDQDKGTERLTNAIRFLKKIIAHHSSSFSAWSSVTPEA